ncbi:hypothetical protein ACNFBT_24190, partial [Pseudomonas sp. NY15181]
CLIRLVKEQLVDSFVSTEARILQQHLILSSVVFENFPFYSTACASEKEAFPPAGGAFYSDQPHCQAPR